MKCEQCGQEHDGSYGSGRFCSAHCARSFSTSAKRDEINRKVSATLRKMYENKPKSKTKVTKSAQAVIQPYSLTPVKLTIMAVAKDVDVSKINVIQDFSMYYASTEGIIYNWLLDKVNPFNSNGYYQVKIKNDNNVATVKGVHQLVAAAFMSDYKQGMIVHHKDENKHNNCLDNLQLMARSAHARLHIDTEYLSQLSKERTPWNKGKKMSEEYRQHCSEGAKKRWEKH